MNYMLLIHEDERIYADGEGSEVWKAIIEAHTGYGEALAQAGVMRGGAGLKLSDTATTIRKTNGAYTVHDGPFAETREQLGGYYLIETENLDEAIEWARKLPFLGDGAVEIRPIALM